MTLRFVKAVTGMRPARLIWRAALVVGILEIAAKTAEFIIHQIVHILIRWNPLLNSLETPLDVMIK